MMLAGLLAGLLAATGLLLAVTALAPQPTPLAERVRLALDSQPTPRLTAGWHRRWRQRLVALDDQLAADLEVTGTTIEQVVARRLLWAAAGAVLPLFFWPVGLARLGVPVVAAPVIGMLGGAAGWWLALHETRDQAAERRRELGLALAAYLQLAATMIRAGTAEEQALRDAAAVGSGWTFDALRRAAEGAVQQGTTLWQAFDDLGEQVGLIELRALGAELRIAARQGSSPARTLTARAAALRDQELATQLAAAQRAEKRMAGPLVGLGLSVVVFIIFPALASFIGL